jgi:hypothetical protein
VACTRIALNLRHGKTRNLIAVALDDGHVKFDDISGARPRRGTEPVSRARAQASWPNA